MAGLHLSSGHLALLRLKPIFRSKTGVGFGLIGFELGLFSDWRRADFWP